MTRGDKLPRVNVRVQRTVNGGPVVGNTLDARCVPIVFVPGIMGTRFDLDGSDWDPDFDPSMLGWSLAGLENCRKTLSVKETPNWKNFDTFCWNVKLDGAEQLPKLPGEPDDPVARYVGRRWCQPSWKFYGKVLLGLEKALSAKWILEKGHSHPVFAFGYDWRKSNSLAAQGLVTYVDEVLERTGAKKVIIVTHSMGGLVTRYACANRGLTPKVAGVVHCALPCNGAIAAYRRFFTGNQNSMDNLGGFPDTQFTNILFGDEWWKYALLISNVPSLFQLMPTHLYQRNTSEQYKFWGRGWVHGAEGVDLDDVYTMYLRRKLPGIDREAPEAPPARADGGRDLTLGHARDIWESTVRPGLRENIALAKAFHAELGSGQHPVTYVVYSRGLKTDEYIDFNMGDRRF